MDLENERVEGCSVCGISGREARLFEAISMKNGIVRVCSACLHKENMPVLRRPTTFQLKESEGNAPPAASRSSRHSIERDYEIRKEREKTDMSLRELVDRNYEKDRREKEKKPRPDLVDHFHWVIMRARRRRKLTHEQLAKEIGEASAAVRMAEEGILPDDDYRFVSKLESFLGVVLIKDRLKDSVAASGVGKQPSRILEFDPMAMKEITIDDLKRMKMERERERLATTEGHRKVPPTLPPPSTRGGEIGAPVTSSTSSVAGDLSRDSDSSVRFESSVSNEEESRGDYPSVFNPKEKKKRGFFG